MSLKQKLQLYKNQLHAAQQRTESGRTENRVFDCPDASGPDRKESEIAAAARGLDAVVRHLDDEYVFVCESVLDLSERIGPYTPKDLYATIRAWQSEPAVHPLSASGLRPEDLLFFDTETTGLASGTGQMIFLIGLARVMPEGVVIRHYFLPGPGHEAAFYDAFLRDVRSLKNLVTFNGKAFDWPRVKTRHRFVRDQVPRLPSFGHFDLLHASRRLWKDRLPSIRLQIVEQEILGIKRAGDVPGKMAPFLYFKFLKHPDAALVRGIIEHNREDVRSLIALYIHLSGKVLGTIPSDDREQFEVARWYMQLGETPRALERFEKLAKHHSRIGEMAKTYVGKLYKKEGRYDQALAIYRELIDRRHLPDDEACVEAAKLMEHHYKNNEQALKYTLLAIQYLRKKERISADARCKREHAYWRRANRLDEKLMGQKGRQRNLNKARNG